MYFLIYIVNFQIYLIIIIFSINVSNVIYTCQMTTINRSVCQTYLSCLGIAELYNLLYAAASSWLECMLLTAAINSRCWTTSPPSLMYAVSTLTDTDRVTLKLLLLKKGSYVEDIYFYKANKIMCYRCAATTFFSRFLIFTKIQGIPSGIPGNFWEFPKFLKNSQKFWGIPLFSKKKNIKKMPPPQLFYFFAQR